MPSEPLRLSSLRYKPLWLAFIPVTLVLLLYAPTRNYPFIGFDDEEYIVFNTFVAGGLTQGNVARALTTAFGANWHPLTTITWQAEVSAFGVRAGPMLFDNALLHAACALLLFAVLRKLTRSCYRSLAVAAMFAVHPLRVESVAWAIERKDTLSLFFGLTTIAAYVWYAARPCRRRYMLVGLSLALGLMSKPMLVTWPALLLLLDVWPLRRWRGVAPGEISQQPAKWLLFEKLPLFVLCGASAAITVAAQKAAAAVRPLEEIPVSMRMLMTPANYFEYLFKTFWPWPQSIYYPYPAELPLGKVIAGSAALIFISWIALRQLRKRPHIAVGWGWFLLTLIPVIGLMQTGGQAIADRYSYHTSIGLLIAVVWTAEDVRRRWHISPRVALLILGVCVSACSVATRSYLRLWASPVALFQHAVDVSSPNWVAHSQLGYYALLDRNWQTAEHELRTSLRLNKSNDAAQHNLALVLENLGQYQEALDHIRAVTLSASAPAEPHVIAGRLLIRLKRYGEALSEAQQAYRTSPDDPRIHRQLAFLYDQAGNAERAAFHFKRVKELDAQPPAPGSAFSQAP